MFKEILNISKKFQVPSIFSTLMACAIPFDELVPNASVRYQMIDGQSYMSIRDLIMMYCSTNRKNASKIWNRMTDDVMKEISPFIHYFQFPGPGEKIQDVITLEGGIKLLMQLPGKSAKSFRGNVAEILTRHLSDDNSLTDEIEEIASPIPNVTVMTRTIREPPEAADDEIFKKRARLRVEAFEETELQEKRLMNVKTSIDLLRSLNDGKIDDRTTVQYGECVKHIMFTGPHVQTVTNEGNMPQMSITISDVAAIMGFNCTRDHLKDIGRQLAAKYREKYGVSPPQQNKYCGGVSRLVNSYTERDRKMMEDVIKGYMNP